MRLSWILFIAIRLVSVQAKWFNWGKGPSTSSTNASTASTTAKNYINWESKDELIEKLDEIAHEHEEKGEFDKLAQLNDFRARVGQFYLGLNTLTNLATNVRSDSARRYAKEYHDKLAELIQKYQKRFTALPYHKPEELSSQQIFTLLLLLSLAFILFNSIIWYFIYNKV